jgi:hypothetical protein
MDGFSERDNPAVQNDTWGEFNRDRFDERCLRTH